LAAGKTHIIAQQLSNTLSRLLSGYPVTLGLCLVGIKEQLASFPNDYLQKCGTVRPFSLKHPFLIIYYLKIIDAQKIFKTISGSSPSTDLSKPASLKLVR
jgi:hypothetical protein